MNINLNATIEQTLVGLRLDQALAKLFSEYSRSQLTEWIRGGKVTINGQPIIKPSIKVELDQLVEVKTELATKHNWQGQAIALNIIYEDDTLLIINKPPGLVVHPGAGVPDQTLVNALLHQFPELDKLPRAGLIHRLDKDTSGLLVVARTLPAHTALTQAMQNREISREYEAIVNGVLISGSTIETSIGRHPVSRIKMSVRDGGKDAVTHYRVIERFQAHTHVRIQLETGRTHQIRVHMAHINYPIVGDQTYGARRMPSKKLSEPLREALIQFKRQALHAAKLGLVHPKTHEPMSWQAPLPDDFQHLLALLKEDIQ